MAATFASLLKNSPDFVALNSGVDRKTSVNGKLSYDDYEAIKVLKEEADQLGINASDFKGDAWDRALNTLRNRFKCSRTKRKETAKQAALLLAAE